MLSFLRRLFSTKPTYPSAVVLLLADDDREIHVLHVIPEDVASEVGCYTGDQGSSFRMNGSREKKRELLGAIRLRLDEGDGPTKFLEKVGTQAKALIARPAILGKGSDVDFTAKTALYLAAHDQIRKRLEPKSSTTEPRLYQIMFVHIERCRPGEGIFELQAGREDLN